MTKQNVINAAQTVLQQMVKEVGIVPRDTSNLAEHGIVEEHSDKGIHISIDLAEAPYAPYTNEPWISAYWRGKKNPNEGWWQNFAEEFTRRLAAALKGVIK